MSGICVYSIYIYTFRITRNSQLATKEMFAKFILLCIFETTVEDAIKYRRSKRWFTLGRMIEVVLNDRYAQVMDEGISVKGTDAYKWHAHVVRRLVVTDWGRKCESNVMKMIRLGTSRSLPLHS